jgi:anti-sigma factor RsiW
MRSCSHEDLEALVDGGLQPEVASEVSAHAASCAECGEELRWLRAEREVMRRRAARAPLAAGDLSHLWSGVESRLDKRPPRRVWLRPASFGFAVAAAAALAFVAGRHAADRQTHSSAPIAVAPGARLTNASARVGGERDPRLVLDEAESQWRTAAGELEQRYMIDRGRLSAHDAERVDRHLRESRRAIQEARTVAGADLDARLAVLDGYAEYVQSLHVLVSDLEVKR